MRNPDLVGETRDAQETKRVPTGETTGMGSEMWEGRAQWREVTGVAGPQWSELKDTSPGGTLPNLKLLGSHPH